MDELRDLSDRLGRALEEVLEAHEARFSVEGGGLRHGSPEWHMTYRYGDLFRLIVFSLESDDSGDTRLRVHVGATDEQGAWAQRDLGSMVLGTAITKHVVSGDLEPIVEQAQQKAESLSQNDLKPLEFGWGMGQGDAGGVARNTKKRAKRAAAKQSAKKAQKKPTSPKKGVNKKQQKKTTKKSVKRSSSGG